MFGVEMKTLLPMVILLLAVGCASDLRKSHGSPAGYTEARRDVEAFKITLKSETPEQLVQAFIPDAGAHYYGGYDYYYKSMINIALRQELEARGAAAYPVLLAHREDKVHLWDYINGPGDYTIGSVCEELLKKLPNKSL
jgi:hypothetical protein